MMCNWKEASTVILTALKNSPVQNKWNYSILGLQRSSKSSFMPNGHVFPGGTTELADSSKEWLNIFSKYNINIKNNDVECIPPIIKNKVGVLPKLLSLKVTAIRETFEETGILLCVSKNETDGNWVSCKLINDVESWRSKVQKDGSEFINLCLENHCCPDISNLFLWSNWLTPTSMGNKRFDTAFFVACLNNIPTAQADEIETQTLCWSSPDALLQLCKEKKIWLPPPQVYETSRLLNFKCIKDLKNFAKSRSLKGCDRWMPVQIKTSDGLVSLLPGDEAYCYKDDYTLTKPTEVNMTQEEFRFQSKILHRMEFFDKTQTRVVVSNYDPTNSHKLPLNKY